MQKIRFLLLPLSWVYGLLTGIRNFFYNIGILKIYQTPKKSICVGNLAVGGTGKTPHVAYLIELLKPNHNISVLSRGFGRKTKGFILANQKSSASEIGDEPQLYNRRYGSEINVAVCEKRVEGINQLEIKSKSTSLYILDDAFQHRAIQCGFNIIVTDYQNIYSKDWVLPAGNLREWKIAHKRADTIIVSKSPSNLTSEEKGRIIKSLKFKNNQVFFSTIVYKDLINVSKVKIDQIEHILLVTGIANPSPLEKEMKKHYKLTSLKFSDHYDFTMKDIDSIHQKFDTFAADNKIIVTTEKDWMRLASILTKKQLEKYPWFFQGMSVQIDREKEFNALINKYVNTI